MVKPILCKKCRGNLGKFKDDGDPHSWEECKRCKGDGTDPSCWEINQVCRKKKEKVRDYPAKRGFFIARKN